MPDLKRLKIACLGVSKDFQDSLIPALIKSLGFELMWVSDQNCDLKIVGPFYVEKKAERFIPKPFRPFFKNISSHGAQKSRGPLRLFLTGENVRHDFQNCDYSISFDLGVLNPKHFRMPYWMEMIDWSAEGVVGNKNLRYGRLLNIDRLMQPLGDDFLHREQKAAIFASHLKEPRGTLLNIVKEQIEVVKFGRTFNPAIKNHLESGLIKYDELQHVAFNLCPENGMYPGYYTEKIPEAFMAGCLPITWTDENVRVDFNPKAFINLAPMAADSFLELKGLLCSKEMLSKYTKEPLLLNRPSIEPLKKFIKKIIGEAVG